MKAIIKLPKCYHKDANEYVKTELRKQQLTLVTRTMKMVSVILHSEFGFGKDRLTRIWKSIIAFTEIMEDDPVRWYHIDKELIDEVGLDISREDYEVMDE